MQYDKRFLNQLVRKRNRLTYARLTLLKYDTEEPIEDMEGYIVDGSISIDGNSALRRTCSLTISVKNPNVSNYSWGLYNKFKLELGINNNINSKYPPVIWFPFGVFVFTEYSTNTSTNNFQISAKGQDKMCLLNGTIGGKLTGIGHRFDVEEIEDTSGAILTKKIPIKTIIREAIHTFAKEPYKNIIINDIDDYGYSIIRSRLEGCTWVLVPVETNMGLSAQLVAETDKTSINITVDNEFFRNWIHKRPQYYDKDGFLCDNKNNLLILYPKYQMHTSNNPDLDGRNPYMLRLLAKGPQELVGYDSEALVYPTELTANVGETLTSVLDKIKKILIDFEYFYDVQGRFVFQRKRTYVTRPFSREIKDGVGQSYILPAAINDEIAYSFDDQELVVSFNESPKLANIKNDFSVWGADENKNPLLYRFAIDSKPFRYTTITVSEKEAKKYKEKYYTYDTDVQLKAQVSFTFDTQNPITDNLGNQYVAWDWREIIYQMAQDQYKWGRLADFEERVAAANPDLYPSGRTGYEQYYVDILGLWHKVYNPWHFLTLLDDGTLRLRINESDITKNIITKEEISQVEQNEINNFNYIVSENTTDNQKRVTSCFLKDLSKTPFWFEMSDSERSAIDKFAIGRIGDRAEVVKEDTIKFMFPLNVPQIVFYRNNLEPQGRFGGIQYKTLTSDEYFYGGFFQVPSTSFTNSTATSEELNDIYYDQSSLFESWRNAVTNDMAFAFWKWKNAINEDDIIVKRNDYMNIQIKTFNYIVQFQQLIERFVTISKAIFDRFYTLWDESEELQDIYKKYQPDIVSQLFQSQNYQDFHNEVLEQLNSTIKPAMDKITEMEDWVEAITTLDDLKSQISEYINRIDIESLNKKLLAGYGVIVRDFNAQNYNTLIFTKVVINDALTALAPENFEVSLGEEAISDINRAKKKKEYVSKQFIDEPFTVNNIEYSNISDLANSTFSKINNTIKEYCKKYREHQIEMLNRDENKSKVLEIEEIMQTLITDYYGLTNCWERWLEIQTDIKKIISQTLTWSDIKNLRNKYYRYIGISDSNSNIRNFYYMFNNNYDFRISKPLWTDNQLQQEENFFEFLNIYFHDVIDKPIVNSEWITDIELRLEKLFYIIFNYNSSKRDNVSWFQAMIQMPNNEQEISALRFLGLTEENSSFRLVNLSNLFQSDINDAKRKFSEYDSLISTFKKKIEQIMSTLSQSFEELIKYANIPGWENEINQTRQLIQGFNDNIDNLNSDDVITKIKDNARRAMEVVDWFVQVFIQNKYYNIEGYVGIPKANTITTQGIFEKVSGQVSAKEKIDEMITKYTYSGATVSLTTVPIYHLEPNTRISISNKITRTSDEYLLTQMTIPLNSKGTMTISATLAPPSSLKEE